MDGARQTVTEIAFQLDIAVANSQNLKRIKFVHEK
jgi:hypothetical protein